MAMPLAEHHERCLHFDDEASHLEGCVVAIGVDVPEKLRVPRMLTFAVAGATLLFKGEVADDAMSEARGACARLPSKEALVRAHAGGFDDALVTTPVFDDLDVAVVEYCLHASNFH